VVAITSVNNGDVILIAGKGPDQGRYMAGALILPDDRQVAAQALASRAAAENATNDDG
jgi:UDP-N-acetylmuramoyl-L-alanyl-D-glutamate--2,6-diaminopimelate ligase